MNKNILVKHYSDAITIMSDQESEVEDPLESTEIKPTITEND